MGEGLRRRSNGYPVRREGGVSRHVAASWEELADAHAVHLGEGVEIADSYGLSMSGECEWAECHAMWHSTSGGVMSIQGGE